MSEPVGSFALVLHTHLPWLAHHGAWPVGEEWLHQAWAGSYLPVIDVLQRLAAEGCTDLVTLGVTPVLAAQLDDAYCRNEFSTWLGFWQIRAEQLAGSADPSHRAAAAREFAAATDAQQQVAGPWSAGASPLLRSLRDGGAVELIGGPATHPFQPLLPDPLVRFGLQVGLDDATVRIGHRPAGIWAPECGYRPGLEQVYAGAGVTHLLLDGPTLQSAGYGTEQAWQLGDSDVVAFGRDLEVTYRVWSPRKGYPGGRWYRDFHTVDDATGFRTARVTGGTVPPGDKAPYDADRAAAAVAHDARDFVDVVRQRLVGMREQSGRPGLVVAAYDTELFGHWWFEGPQWLEAVLRMLPQAGVRVTTLTGAMAAGHVGGRAHPGEGSWGSGKDWRVWDGPAVADMVDDNARLSLRLQKELSSGDRSRNPARDQLATTGLLALASDWAFMVSKDTAANYARERHDAHHADFHALADAVEAGDSSRVRRLVSSQHATDAPFQHLDARAYRG